MVTAFPSRAAFPGSLSWDEALGEFVLHLRATRAPKTARYYKVPLHALTLWADANDVPLVSFGKRPMDRFMADCRAAGLRPTTLHHDAICARNFLRWCVKNDILERNWYFAAMHGNGSSPLRRKVRNVTIARGRLQDQRAGAAPHSAGRDG